MTINFNDLRAKLKEEFAPHGFDSGIYFTINNWESETPFQFSIGASQAEAPFKAIYAASSQGFEDCIEQLRIKVRQASGQIEITYPTP